MPGSRISIGATAARYWSPYAIEDQDRAADADARSTPSSEPVPFSRSAPADVRVSPSPDDSTGIAAVEIGVRDDADDLGHDLRDGVGADHRPRRERAQHEQVEARVDELQQAADLGPDAVPVRRGEQRPREADAAARRAGSRPPTIITTCAAITATSAPARPVSATTSRSTAAITVATRPSVTSVGLPREPAVRGEQARRSGSRPASPARARRTGTRRWCRAGRRSGPARRPRARTPLRRRRRRARPPPRGSCRSACR